MGGERPRRVLIVRIGAMGDVLHAMPAVAALREAHPEWFISWAIEPRWSELLQGACCGDMPLVNELQAVRTREWQRRPFSGRTVREILALRQELSAERFDLCVDMQGLLKSAVVGRMAGATVFAGPANPREAPAGWLYGLKVQRRAAHVIEQGCELLGGAVGGVLRPARVTLPRNECAERWCDGLPGAEPGQFVLMAPTAGWGAKRWPAERFGRVAVELGRAGFRTLVNAVTAEDKVALEVVAASEGFATVAACSLGEMIALARRAALVIAGDSGPLHLAAALGRPVVGLYGPTDPARTGPYGGQSRVLRHASSREDHRRLTATEAGLELIGVDEVTAAALELLQNEKGRGAV
jgi:heptosyltransferase I